MKESYLFLADLHLGVRDFQRIQIFNRILARLPQHCRALFLLGDLFDFWAGSNQQQLRTMRIVIAGLQKAIRRGLHICFLPGNRDFLFAYNMHRLGGHNLPDGIQLVLDNHRLSLYHGDTLCTRDQRYQKMKRIIRSRVLVTLSRCLPPLGCLWIGRCMRALSRREVGSKRPEEMGLVPQALYQVFHAGSEVVICGHVHQKSYQQYTLNGRQHFLYVLPGWQQRLEALCLQAGQFHWQVLYP